MVVASTMEMVVVTNLCFHKFTKSLRTRIVIVCILDFSNEQTCQFQLPVAEHPCKSLLRPRNAQIHCKRTANAMRMPPLIQAPMAYSEASPPGFPTSFATTKVFPTWRWMKALIRRTWTLTSRTFQQSQSRLVDLIVAPAQPASNSCKWGPSTSTQNEQTPKVMYVKRTKRRKSEQVLHNFLPRCKFPPKHSFDCYDALNQQNTSGISGHRRDLRSSCRSHATSTINEFPPGWSQSSWRSRRSLSKSGFIYGFIV